MKRKAKGYIRYYDDEYQTLIRISYKEGGLVRIQEIYHEGIETKQKAKDYVRKTLAAINSIPQSNWKKVK